MKGEPTGVTTRMKALNEYFLMVVFTLLLNRLHVFVIFKFIFILRQQQYHTVNHTVCVLCKIKHVRKYRVHVILFHNFLSFSERLTI